MKENIKKILEKIYLLAKNHNDLESKISLYQFFASSYWHNYSNSFAHLRLEKDLIALSEEIISSDCDNKYEDDHILHIMTEAYLIGGHTRVVDNWIKSVNGKHSVILNNPYSLQPSFLVESVKSKKGKIIINDNVGFVAKANFLFKIASHFKYVVLHHHPHDILPLLAFGTKKFSRPIFFYNHADYVWGCGYSVSDKLIELSKKGMEFSNKYRGIPMNRIIFGGVPIEFETHPSFEICKKNKKYIVTMASSYKFHPIKDLTFQNFIYRILEATEDIEYYAIGVSKDDEHWQILKYKYPLRVHLKGELNKTDAHEIVKKSTLYLDSFPLGSTTSLIEAVSLGIPILSYKSPIQHMDSYSKYSYSNLDELFDEVIRVLSLSDIERHKISIETWELIKKWHDIESFKVNISNLDSIDVHSPIKLEEEIIEDDYKQIYTDFLYDVLRQKNFIFDSKIVDNISFSLKKELTNLLCSLGNFEYTNKLRTTQTWIDYLLENYLSIQIFHEDKPFDQEKTNEEILIEVDEVNTEIHIPKINNIFLSRKISLMLKKIIDIKEKKLKILLYGHGYLGKLLADQLKEELVAIVDKDLLINNKKENNIISLNEIKNYEYDCIIISVIGREMEIIKSLIRYGVDIQKIVVL